MGRWRVWSVVAVFGFHPRLRDEPVAHELALVADVDDVEHRVVVREFRGAGWFQPAAISREGHGRQRAARRKLEADNLAPGVGLSELSFVALASTLTGWPSFSALKTVESVRRPRSPSRPVPKSSQLRHAQG